MHVFILLGIGYIFLRLITDHDDRVELFICLVVVVIVLYVQGYEATERVISHVH